MLVTLGLCLGKFAPLHNGHQLLIDTALAEVDQLIVLIYDAPATTTVPLPVRSGWLRTLYPQVEVIEGWDGPEQVGATPAITKMQDDYILSQLRGRTVTHFFSSEFYGEHVSRALGAIDRRVDPQRAAQPISATKLRADPFRAREYLSAIVYRDLITKVVFLGAPCTGKSTITEQAAALLETAWVPEYGREYWEKHQVERRLTPAQLLEIAQTQYSIEEAQALNANRFLFIDTDATTTRMFAHAYHGSALPELEALADAARSRYDLCFLCADDIPYDATWDRSGAVQRTIMQKKIRADLLRRKTPFISLRGSPQQRLHTVAQTLQGFDKFLSVGDVLRDAQRVDRKQHDTI